MNNSNNQSQLDKPLTFKCGVTIPNRISLAPLTNTQSNSDGTLHEDELQWLLHRAGHFGLLSTCAAFISPEGKAWEGQLGISSDTHLPGLTRLATELINAGSVPIVQLHHAGSRADLAPIKLSTTAGDNTHAATLADIKRVTNQFVSAALRAEKAGFLGVEIHGANGYLFTQFLAPADNPRTDAYGGDLIGRARFLREVMQAVRAATSSNFIVGVRISPVDSWTKRGLLLQDGIQLAQWLAEDGADFIHLSLMEISDPAPHEETGIIVIAAIRNALPKDVALIAAGNVWTRTDAEKAESLGVDIVALGRAAFPHPDWPSASLATSFKPMPPPWTPDFLRSVAVGPALLTYIKRYVIQD